MVALLAILAFSRVAAADTLFFADNFNRTDDFDLDASTNGMSGLLMTNGFTVSNIWLEPIDLGRSVPNDSAVTNNTLRMGGNGHSVNLVLDRNFATLMSTGVLSISMKLNGSPLPNDGSALHRYEGIGFGFGQAEGNVVSATVDRVLSRVADVFVGSTANGRIRVNDEAPSSRVATGDLAPTFTMLASNGATAYVSGTLRLDFTITNAAIGSTVGYAVLFDAGSTGNFVTLTNRSFVLSGNFELYAGVEERSTPSVFADDFSVSALGAYSAPANVGIVWRAQSNNNWDTTTTNWVDATSGANQLFTSGISVRFGDTTSNSTVNIPANVTPGTVSLENVSSNYTFSGAGAIAGTANLVKTGLGSVTLGSPNTYSGGSAISAGRIRIGSDNALGTGLLTLGGGALSSDGGTARTITNAVRVAGSSTIGDVTDNGTITFNQTVDFAGGLRNLNTSNNVVFNAGATNGILGSKLGTGTLTIKGLVEFSGAADVQDGTLIYDGATVHNTDRVIADTFTANGIARLIITNGASVVVSNTVGNLRSGRQTSTGSNYVDLAGPYAVPNADVSNGRLTLQANAAYSEMTFWPGGDYTTRSVGLNGTGSGTTVFRFNGGILRARNDNATFFEGLSQALVLAGGARIDDGGFAIVINQALQDGSGGGGLTKTGAGTLTLNGANNYTGTTVVSNGTLALNTSSLSGGGAIVVANNASLSISNVSSTLAVPSVTLGGGATNTLKFNFPSGNPGGASLNASTLTANNYVKIDIAGSGFTLGTFTLVDFTTCTGLNNFHLGTLAPGLTATLVTNATSIALNVTATGKSLLWTGAANNQWNTSSIDWADLNNGNAPVSYSQSGGVGDAVTFDDTALTNIINVTTTVTPISLTFNNGGFYTLGGAGKISGIGSLKTSSGQVTLNTANDYSGGTIVNGPIVLGANQALGTGPATLNVNASLASDSAVPRTLSNSIVQADSSVFYGSVINTGALTLAGGLNLGGSNRTLYLNSDVILTGPMTNGGVSLKQGSGTLYIRANSSLAQVAVGQQNGDVIIDGATVTTLDGWRVQSFSSATVRLVVTNGAVLNVSQTSLTGNLRVGFGTGDNTASNIVDISGTVNLTPTGTVGGNNSVGLGQSGANDIMYLRSGGLLITRALFGQPNDTTNSNSEVHFMGGTIRAMVDDAGFITGLTNAFMENGGLTIDSTNFTVTVAQPLLASGTGGLNKIGSGTLNLTGASTYTGGTIVSNGTLNVNGSVVGAATVRSGATLGGTGSIGGVVTVQSGGTLSAGFGAIGSLSLGASPVLNGSVAAEINRNGGSPLADIITVAGPVTYGGTLVITNIGAPLLAGDAFTLVSASGHSGSFSSIVGAPGAGLAYSFTNGILSVVSASSIANNPTNITSSVSGTTLSLSWPADHLGWFLQSQTNSRAIGLKAADVNWFDLAGSDSATNATITIDRANPTVFYRLRHP